MSTKRASRFAQVSASVRAMKSKMLGRDGYDRLLRCSGASECISVLGEESYFGAATTQGEFPDSASLQNLLDTKMLTVIHKLARLSPDDCAGLMAEFENLYRLEFLKSGLRIMITHEGLPSGITPPGLGADYLVSLTESRDVDRLIRAVGARALYDEVSFALSENKPLPLVEAMVDKYGLMRIWGATDMHDWMDKGSTQPLVGEQIDAVNLLVVARSKALGITSEEIQQFLLPVNYRLRDALPEALGSESATSALRTFTKTLYAKSVAPFLETYKEGAPLYQLDVSLRRQHAESCLSAFSGFPFCAGLPLAFVYLVSYELSDLRSIISGLRDGLSTDRIEQSLILQKAL